ncbi:MAG TPA: hypothetical protein VF021_11215 [Longimicrobiales bacterium]
MRSLVLVVLLVAVKGGQAAVVTLPDTGRVQSATIPWRVPDAFEAALVAPADTPQAPLIEYSDAYATRLTIHRLASWTMLPLFAAQYYTGAKLYSDGASAPAWVRKSHGPLATGVAVLFGVNTVTGVWNLLEARKDPAGRTRRTIHSVLMLAADAGFATTGVLANQAENSSAKRSLHRTVALSSMGVAALSWIIMLVPSGGD